MTCVYRLVALWTLLLALVAGGRTIAGPVVATDGDAAGFARACRWFESLGYPDLMKLPFVRVWTGGYMSIGGSHGKGERIELEPALGWLLWEQGADFRVFTTELRVDRFRRRDGGGRTQARVAYDRIDLAVTVRDGLAAFAKRLASDPLPSPLWEEGDPFDDLRGLPPLSFKGFVLAYACSQVGEDDLALALWRRFASVEPWPPKPPWNALDRLKDAIGHEARRTLVLDLEAQEGSWSDHLAAHRRWLERFPGHAEINEVRAAIAALEKTARVEEARRRTQPKAMDALSAAERADALVSRLTEPFSFLDNPSDGDTLTCSGVAVPAKDTWVLAKLIAVGQDAIPRLIEALTDDRWTRSVSAVGGPGNGILRDEYYVERVADLALVALGAITGVDFSDEGRIRRTCFLRGPGDSIVVTGDAAAAQAKARAWWTAHHPHDGTVK
jgi:hypothetical protein